MSEKQPTVFRVDSPRHKDKVINTKNRKTINASNDVSDTLYVVDIIGSKKTGKTELGFGIMVWVELQIQFQL